MLYRLAYRGLRRSGSSHRGSLANDNLPGEGRLVSVSRNPLRVVIAEDEALIRLDLKEMLEEEGYSVVAEAGDGESAVERVAARAAAETGSVIPAMNPSVQLTNSGSLPDCRSRAWKRPPGIRGKRVCPPSSSTRSRTIARWWR